MYSKPLFYVEVIGNLSIQKIRTLLRLPEQHNNLWNARLAESRVPVDRVISENPYYAGHRHYLLSFVSVSNTEPLLQTSVGIARRSLDYDCN